MKHHLFPAMVLLATTLGLSCTDQQDPDPVGEPEKTAIFDKELFTPSGQLGYVYTYQFKEDYIFKEQRLYDSKNRNII